MANKKMNLSYILNKEPNTYREIDINNSINDITRNCLTFTGYNTKINKKQIRNSFNVLTRSQNKRELANTIKKLRHVQVEQYNYMTNVINYLNKNLLVSNKTN
jgi:hypothetical protein